MVLGTLYLWANVTAPVTSYLRIHDPKITYNDTIYVYICALAFDGLIMLVSESVQERLGPRITALLGGYILALAAFLSSFATSLNFLIFTEGIMFGCGFGLAYTAPITCASQWMPEKKALLTGIIISGIGAGAFLFSALAEVYVNPRGLSILGSSSGGDYYSEDTGVPERVPQMYLMLSACYFMLATAGGMLIRPFSERELIKFRVEQSMQNELYEKAETRDLDEENSSHSAAVELTINRISNTRSHTAVDETGAKRTTSGMEEDTLYQKHFNPSHNIVNNPDANPPDELPVHYDEGYSPFDLLWLPAAWHLCLCFLFTTVGGMYVAGTFKTLGERSFTNENYVSAVGSFSAIFNSLGRVFWGYVGDRIGSIHSLAMVNFVFAVAIWTYPYSVTLREVGYSAWTFLIFFCEGGNFALYPPIVIQMFGMKHSGANYSLFFGIFTVFTVLSISFISEMQMSLGFSFMLLGLITFCGAIGLSCIEYFHITNYEEIIANSQ